MAWSFLLDEKSGKSDRAAYVLREK